MELHIKFTDVGKKFPMYRSRLDQVRELLHPRGRRYHKEFWALRNVSFELERGQSLGIIGRNGSGKSTLLQILCRIMQPTEGSVSVNGRISALLELGAGFNKQFTGRQNVYLNGTLMGFSREQMDNRIDDIAAFADIGEFIDQPVKTYSSGMYVRLAFASAVHVDPNILIVDEALAVGDTFFQNKCHAHMEKLMGGGVTVVMVTHDMKAVHKYCTRGMVLQKGSSIFQGDVLTAIRMHMHNLRGPKSIAPSATPDKGLRKDQSEIPVNTDSVFTDWPSPEEFVDISRASIVESGWAECTGLAISDTEGNPVTMFEIGERVVFHYEFRALRDLERPVGTLTLVTTDNIVLHGKATYQYQNQNESSNHFVPKGAYVRIRQEMQLNIAAGRYIICIALGMVNEDLYQSIERLSSAQERAMIAPLCNVDQAAEIAVVESNTATISLPHMGLCDLPGSGGIEIAIPTRRSTESDGNNIAGSTGEAP